MDRLARLLLPTIYAVWKKLLPVQKADIYRYIVTGLLGGYYGDADTVCKRPILQWGHGGKTAFVSGVEAQNVKVEGEKYHPGQRTVQLTQYAFASAAFHPIMLDLLAKIVSFADVIVASSEPTLTDTQRLARILATTGPVIFTDCIVQYACYINASSTPNTLWDGGSVPGLRIFGIEGFGAGQYHSLAPPATDKRVLVHHVFGASKALKGEAWFRQKREAAAKEKEKEKAGVPGKAPA
ncbi:hypothetical protein DFJ74DRAFT_656088 [Hyaloraphidium curvatum]|nr:hypothetical protein DFJ74DRAFT_656088 [Hyaloraphidium curvatum]